jgi:hypothetical protein
VGLGFCVQVYVTAEAVEGSRAASVISAANAVRLTRPVRRRSRVPHAPPPTRLNIGCILFPPTENRWSKPQNPPHGRASRPPSFRKLSLCQISVKHPTRNS